MDQNIIIEQIEARAKAADVSMAVVCERAGLARSTFSRWKASKRNPTPIGMTFKSLRKLESALSDLEQQSA